MKKWVAALVCTVAAGALAGGAAAWAVSEGNMAALERDGCNLVIENDSGDALYGITVSCGKDGGWREAVSSRYMSPGTEAYFSVDLSGDEDCFITLRINSRRSVTAQLGEEFDPEGWNVYRVIEGDGEYDLIYEVS